MSDPAKILAKNEKELMKLVLPLAKKSSVYQNAQDSENISLARTSTPVKTITAISRITPMNSRNSSGLQSFISPISSPFTYVLVLVL